MRAVSEISDALKRSQFSDRRLNSETLNTAALALTHAIRVLGELELVAATDVPDLSSGIDFYAEVSRFEVLLIRRALRNSGGNQTRAAAALGLKLTTLNTKVKRYKVFPL